MGRRFVVAVVAAAVGSACGTTPEVGGREAVRAMVLETCAPGGDAVQTEICTCAFDALVEDLDADALESLDRQLRDDPETVPPEVQEAVLACSFEQVAPPTSKTTTTMTTTVDEEDDADEADEDASTTAPRP